MWSDISFKEKSIGISLFITLLLPIYYWRQIGDPALINTDVIMPLLAKMIVFFIIVEVVAHIVIAIIDHKDAERKDDERDKLINLHAYRVSYLVLSALLIVFIFIGFVHSSLERIIVFPQASLLVNILHYLWLAIIVSDAAKYITQLYLYRRGF